MRLTNSISNQQYTMHALDKVYALNNHVRLITRVYGKSCCAPIFKSLDPPLITNVQKKNIVHTWGSYRKYVKWDTIHCY